MAQFVFAVIFLLPLTGRRWTAQGRNFWTGKRANQKLGFSDFYILLQ
jgi:hypothetical protein